MTKRKKIGVALGEGGARGLVHIGVLQVLKEEGLDVDIIAGTSIGAIIGAMYSETLDPFFIESRFYDLINSELYIDLGVVNLQKSEKSGVSFWHQILTKFKGTIALTLAQAKISIFDDKRFIDVLDFLISIDRFTQCKIPFIAVATDLKKGREMPLCAGNLKTAVKASASIPGFFPPVLIDGHILSDGAIACPVPVNYARLSEKTYVIGIATPPKLAPIETFDNAIEVLIRSEEINMYYLTKALVKAADLSIIADTKGIEWNEFHYIDELIHIGRESAKKVVPQIKKDIGIAKFFFF